MISCIQKYCSTLFLALFFLVAETAAAQGNIADAARAQTTPAHVYAQLQRVEQLVDAIGLYMGVQEPEPLAIVVTNAAPHDVYFQVRSLLLKANRFSYEQSRRREAIPPVFSRENVEPADVKRMVDAAFMVLSTIYRDLGLTDLCPMIGYSEGITPSQVFMASVRVNRYLNILLERRFSPSEVYKVVNTSIGYASYLLGQYPGTERIPAKPTYEKNKRPLDVYYRLHTCLLSIIEIYKMEGLNILEVDIGDIEDKNISPSDVFDMASLVLARLDLLSRKKNIHRSIRETYYPGRKVPSDVYQQSGILQQQLTMLLSVVKKSKLGGR